MSRQIVFSLPQAVVRDQLDVPEYRTPRLAVYDYGHSCEKGFSPFRETPFSVAESGSMPLGVSRLPFPQQLPAISSRLFLKIGI